ncbi:ROK family protein [Marinilactibacillus psychrotolerans]|uniref:ROK family protein n=2 Tax=Marinilactibacillus psychrotolerans TaxID=191770 RepID=A0ABW8UKV5_9LACT|nr:ROK family protein [Marinilactibacillus psychrotolerans]SJN27216.1 N-acetylmannosamine kinase [Marinilactibacillus psychrotolerans 42ea]
MYIGIDIGGTNTKFGIINEQGLVLEKSMIPTKYDKLLFLESLTAIILKYKNSNSGIKGIGISAPGIIQKNGLLITAGAIKTLYGVNLKLEIESRTNLPTVIENDANAAAIAEKWVGNAKNFENYLCLVLGTGIGGGIILNNQVYRGGHGMAGEFGWMMIDTLPEQRNLESVSLNQRAAVVGGLCHQYALAMKKLDSGYVEILDAKEIINKALENDVVASKVVSEFYRDLSVGVLNLIGCFDPEAILIGGGISENEKFMIDFIKSLKLLESRHASLNYIKEKIPVKIIPAKCKNDAGMIGAVYQIIQELKLGSGRVTSQKKAL